MASTDERIARDRYPWWVKVSLWGVPGRGGLWGFVALSVAGAIGCFIYGFRDARSFYFPVPLLIAGLLYWSAIRWVDRHGSWD